MLLADDLRRVRRLRTRHLLVLASVLVSVLAWPTGAYAQAACDSSAVDQYVECIPTSEGDKGNQNAAGGGGGGGSNGGSAPLAPGVSNEITSQGGDDAGVLLEVATSPTYGAPTKELDVAAAGESGTTRVGKEGDVLASPQADVTAADTLAAAASAVQGGDAGRLVALLLGLFLVSVATLGAAAMRQKRRASA